MAQYTELLWEMVARRRMGGEKARWRVVVDGEELDEGVEGLGGKFGVMEAGTREKVGEGAQGRFDLGHRGRVVNYVVGICRG